MARSTSARGFTLTEVMIAASIGSFVLLGVLTTFLLLGRSGVSVVNYTEMDTQTRKGLEEFAQDVRMASGIVWNSSTSVTLTVPENYPAHGNQVTYAWDNTVSSAGYRCFYRKPGAATVTADKTIFIRNVTDFIYNRFDRLNAPATTDAATKRLQVSLTVTSSNRTVVNATDATLSASFILRNKTYS